MHLEIPEDYGIVNMVSIDPGSNTCGMAVYELDTSTRTINSIMAFTIHVEKLNDNSGLHLDLATDRFVKILKLCNVIKNIIESTNARIVVSEAPFFNKLMPMAYGSLLEIVSSINRTVHETGNEIIFTSYAPQQVKMSLSAAGIKGKDVIKEKLMEVPEVYSKIVGDYDLLDEHSIDAIAVGYTFLVQRCGKKVWK